MIFRALDPELGVSIGERKVSNMRYSDDTALTADSGSELQRIATRVYEAGKELSMKMNMKKTKTMVISKKGIVSRVNIELNGQVVEQVSCFTYLSQTITEDGKCDEEIERRNGQARPAFNTMRDVLCYRRLQLSSRLRLFKCIQL